MLQPCWILLFQSLLLLQLRMLLQVWVLFATFRVATELQAALGYLLIVEIQRYLMQLMSDTIAYLGKVFTYLPRLYLLYLLTSAIHCLFTMLLSKRAAKCADLEEQDSLVHFRP